MLSINKKEYNFPGVYKITFNDKCYIGSSVCIYNRLLEHRAHLRKNKHQNKHLQSCYNKYGENTMKISIIEKCKREVPLLRNRELFYINLELPIFNKTTPITYVQLEETKLQISNTLKRKYTSGEIINHNKGKGILLKVLNYYGEVLYESITISELTNKLGYSNRSVIRLSLLRGNHLFKNTIVFKINENFLYEDWINKINGKILPIYKIYKNGEIKKCSNSSKEKVINKIMNNDFMYYSLKNKCYYTFLGNLIKCPYYKKL